MKCFIILLVFITLAMTEVRDKRYNVYEMIGPQLILADPDFDLYEGKKAVKKKLRIYDIDGTLTHPGNDLWYLTTQALSVDKELFEERVKIWKQQMKHGRSPYDASYDMMKEGLALMGSYARPIAIKETAKNSTVALIKSGKYFKDAIEHIRISLREGYGVILSTTNYQEGGEAFLEALVETHLLSSLEAAEIFVSGTKIDWNFHIVRHFNMGDDKVKGICDLLGIKEGELIGSIDSSYGDDPDGNDKGILNLGPKAFVIKNTKNGNRILPPHMQLTDWECILQRNVLSNT